VSDDSKGDSQARKADLIVEGFLYALRERQDPWAGLWALVGPSDRIEFATPTIYAVGSEDAMLGRMIGLEETGIDPYPLDEALLLLQELAP
jgi:hypothetical protein